MHGRLGQLRALGRDATGQTAVEYSLIIAVFGIPMIVLGFKLLSVLAAYYKMVVFLETLPYP